MARFATSEEEALFLRGRRLVTGRKQACWTVMRRPTRIMMS